MDFAQILSDPVCLVAIIVALLSFLYVMKGKRHRNLPPGPKPWPIIGNIPHIMGGVPFYEVATQLRREYGDLVRLRLGPFNNFVFIMGQEKIHKAAITMNDKFKYRPTEFFVTNYMFQKKGLFFSNGDVHAAVRKFTLGAMRDFGVGKKSLEGRMQEEASILAEVIEKFDGKPVYLLDNLKMAVSNIIAGVVYGNRLEYDDPTFQELISNIDIVFKELSALQPENFIPALRFLPGSKRTTTVFKSSYGGRQELSQLYTALISSYELRQAGIDSDESEHPHNVIRIHTVRLKPVQYLYGLGANIMNPNESVPYSPHKKNIKFIYKYKKGDNLKKHPKLTKVFGVFKDLERYAKSRVEEHRATFDPDNIRDFVDLFLEHEGQGSGDGAISEDNLFRVIIELFNAGTDTTATTLIWAIIHLIKQPNIQDKCRKEIMEVVGSGRFVNLEDKKDMPYLQAFIDETLRYSSIAPQSAPHSVMEDTESEGYTIPKHSVVFFVLYTLLMDKERWGDPENFRPERFLSQTGQLTEDKEYFAPFSLGGRSCIGKHLAKQELFIFLGTLIQRFEFKSPPGCPPPSTRRIQTGVTSQPERYDICAVPLNK